MINATEINAALAACTDDMKSASSVGRTGLDAQVRAYDLLSSLLEAKEYGGDVGISMELAGKMPQGSKILGIDLSEGMMEIGREKIAEAGVRAEMIQGDCEALPFEDSVFDRISVGFGVRNFENLDKGLKEMNRVMKPGGKLVILELSVPSGPVLRWCYKLYFLKVLPLVGGWISGDRGAYEYLPASVLRFPAPDRFMEMMRKAGFRDVMHRSFTFGICRMYVGSN